MSEVVDGLHPWYIEVIEFCVNVVRVYGPVVVAVALASLPWKRGGA